MNAQRKLSRDKAVKADFRKGRILKQVHFWKPTLKERLAIAAGGNLLIMVKVITEHSPGRCAVASMPYLTSCLTSEDANFQIESNKLMADSTLHHEVVKTPHHVE